MKLNVIMFKNLKINAFTTPNFTDLEPEVAAKQLERSLVINQNDEKLISPYRSLDMYFMATFDDETGIYKPVDPVLLFSPRELLLQIDAQKLAAEKKVEVAEV